MAAPEIDGAFDSFDFGLLGGVPAGAWYCGSDLDDVADIQVGERISLCGAALGERGLQAGKYGRWIWIQQVERVGGDFAGLVQQAVVDAVGAVSVCVDAVGVGFGVGGAVEADDDGAVDDVTPVKIDG